MIEYSPLPGTLISKVRDVTDEPWTKNRTGRGGSPDFGAPSRLRNIHKGTSPFLAQYSPLQISPPCAVDVPLASLAARTNPLPRLAAPIPAAPRPAPLISARRAIGRSRCFINSSGLFCFWLF